ncbi:alpha/beta hydrolase [Bdellovibrio sp. 22V]|uniref:alpha/beta fold hydrolase n=1 Tax=Bdellovibrio TaxID=958 RepID=UPI00254392E3|nr:alpha/beta hydrolase [Bdellovibrio sp. 22V]WII70855.1 alpha/beta hydrolase [Bdellovibrio sp. 22V]
MKALLVFIPFFILAACTHSPKGSSSKNPAPQAQSGYAPVNGLNLYYEIYEPTEELHNPIPLLLLHGGGETIESNYARFIPLIAKHRRVIAMEEQGHGHTVAINRPFTFDNSAKDAAALLEYLKIEKADIMGFSNGGTVALRVAHFHPHKVNKLIIASAQYRRDGMIKGFWDGMNKARIEDMPKSLLDADRKINPDPKHQEQLFLQDSKRMQNFKDIPEKEIKSISSPTLVIIGDKDAITVEHAARMSRTLPHGRLAVLPGTHGSYIGEVSSGVAENSRAPEATALFVSEFLDSK